jgi:hypothetical protein
MSAPRPRLSWRPNTPRDHHFIPVFYLKQWVGPTNKLVEYSIKHDKLIANTNPQIE